MKDKIEFYGGTRYNFLDAVRKHLNVYDLTRIHELCDNVLVTRETDQDNPFQKRFYSIDEPFYTIYREFVHNFVEPIFGEKVVYQKIPTFRIQLPDNLAVGEKHKDSDYSHSTDEVNFWVPLTPAYDTNTIWIEGEPVQPMTWGEVLIFDGANKEHENKVNKEGASRVSFDFRVMPKSKFKPSDKESINTHMKMDIGGYWCED